MRHFVHFLDLLDLEQLLSSNVLFLGLVSEILEYSLYFVVFLGKDRINLVGAHAVVVGGHQSQHFFCDWRKLNDGEVFNLSKMPSLL